MNNKRHVSRKRPERGAFGQKPGANLLLQNLPQHSRAALLTLATPVELPRDFILFQEASTPQQAHFLTSGLVKLVVPLHGGEGVECGLIGYEGLPEAQHLLGAGSLPVRAMIQAPATALRVPFDKLQSIFHHDSNLRGLVDRFNQLQIGLSWLVSSCNALHDVEQRLARLLLMSSDRASDTVLPMTHDCLSHMLGTRRTTVSQKACVMQKAGIIEYWRGDLRIIDRGALQKTSCGCYRETHRLLAEYKAALCQA